MIPNSCLFHANTSQTGTKSPSRQDPTNKGEVVVELHKVRRRKINCKNKHSRRQIQLTEYKNTRPTERCSLAPEELRSYLLWVSREVSRLLLLPSRVVGRGCRPNPTLHCQYCYKSRDSQGRQRQDPTRTAAQHKLGRCRMIMRTPPVGIPSYAKLWGRLPSLASSTRATSRGPSSRRADKPFVDPTALPS